MGKVIQLERDDDGGFEESAHLFDLCRIGCTRGFILRNSLNGERRHFVCVTSQNAHEAVALYSQIEGDNLTSQRFYFETLLEGGYSEAVKQAIQYLGDHWMPVGP